MAATRSREDWDRLTAEEQWTAYYAMESVVAVAVGLRDQTVYDFSRYQRDRDLREEKLLNEIVRLRALLHNKAGKPCEPAKKSTS